MSKKELLILGALAMGGIGVATMLSDGSGGGGGTRAGGIVGSRRSYGAEGTTNIYNLPAQGAVTFPDPPSFDISSILSKPAPTVDIGRGAAGVSAAPKKKVIYGGYKPSGETYVFGGKAFESQAAKEIATQGYSPTIGAAFGIKPSNSVKKSVSTPKATAKAATRRASLVSRAKGVSK